MVMISFVGVATFDKPGTGATSILQAVIWVSPKRQLRNAKLTSCCASYASCAAARGAAVGALGSQPVVMTYRTPRHIDCSPHRSKCLREEPFYARFSGQRREAYCYSCFAGGCPWPAPATRRCLTISKLRLHNKRKKRRKYSLGEPMSLIGHPD
jgi:hypothetical protein